VSQQKGTGLSTRMWASVLVGLVFVAPGCGTGIPPSGSTSKGGDAIARIPAARIQAPHMSRPAVPIGTVYYDPLNGLTLSPPTLPPVISGEQAVQVAWAEGGPPSDPSGVTAVYGLLTWSEYDNLPAWLVSFLDVCQHPNGPGTATDCVVRPWSTLVDATSGEYLASYSDGT